MRSVLDVMSRKADRTDIDTLHQRVNSTNSRVDALETHVEHEKRSARETTERRTWLWPAITGVAVAVATVALVLVSLH